jgi:hypothetical protein
LLRGKWESGSRFMLLEIKVNLPDLGAGRV